VDQVICFHFSPIIYIALAPQVGLTKLSAYNSCRILASPDEAFIQNANENHNKNEQRSTRSSYACDCFSDNVFA